MKLGEALSKLKKERSRLARMISLRKENIYCEDGKKTSFNPILLTKEINKKKEEIRKLKIKIQKTNLATDLQGENISLAEAIIKINDLRSNLCNMSNLFEKKEYYIFREKEKKEMIAQLDEREIEDDIEKIEIEKNMLDNKIQLTNWTTKLID